LETYIKLMNEKLKAYYGSDVDSHPRFRLAWTEDLIEKRESEFSNPAFPGKYFKEVREVKKYSYIKDRWILEVHTPQQVLAGDVKTPDHFEPLWLFTINKGQYYKPKWEDLVMVISSFINNVVKPVKKNEAIIKSEFEAKKEQEELNIYDVLQQGSNFLNQQLHEGEAVSFAGVKPFKGDS